MASDESSDPKRMSEFLADLNEICTELGELASRAVNRISDEEVQAVLQKILDKHKSEEGQ